MSKNTSQKQSIFKTNFDCDIENFSNEIMNLVQAKSKGELYTKFVEKFLTYIPIDYRAKDKLCFFEDFTDNSYKFFQNRKKQDRKIEIITSEFNKNPALTILILCDNKPFIIDSLNCLLTKMGMQPLFSFHPVINCKRDNDGNLVEIMNKGEEGRRETIVFIKLLGTFETQTITNLNKEINKILDLVSYTYDSWQTLLNKMTGITTEIVHHKDIYEQQNFPVEETIDFLNWLQKNNFTFLGMVDFDIKSNKITSKEGVEEIWQDNLDELKTIVEYSSNDEHKYKLALLGKLNKISPVHRGSLVDYILIRQLDKNGNYTKATVIFGLYGTAIYYQSIMSVPILRGKFNYVVDESDFPPNGYFAKKLKNIIESLPRENLIQIDERNLFFICLHMLSAMESRNFKIFAQEDWSSSFLNIIMFMPRERLTPDAYKKITTYIQEKFCCEIITDNITVVAQDFAHLFVTIPINNKVNLDFSLEEIEKDLLFVTTDWKESFCMQLIEEHGDYHGTINFKEIEPAIPTEYRYKFDGMQTIADIHHLRLATQQDKAIYNLINGEGNTIFLKIYNPETALTLSDILPAIENLGFKAIDEQSFLIKPFQEVKQSWLYEFRLESPIEIDNFELLKQNVEIALDKMTEGILTSDSLSQLLVMANFDWKKIKLIKALSRYLHQTCFTYGKGYVQLTLVKHYNFTKMLVELFNSLFDPIHKSDTTAHSIDKKINEYLDTVDSSAEDKVLRHMHLIIKAILRTNYFQITDGEIKEYFSFKFDSSKVPELPLPLPYAEIFVYSHDFEGVHLRGGKVARGGLRWSDRGEDYRTEVLGLMKSQMTKNTVIVPEGSKGTFYVNISQGTMSRDEYMNKVVHCYKNFLRGLLDLTDNLIDGNVVHPASTVIKDDENPYLVVAADKGTASFSDFANEVSAEYCFWLGDAFASGGSVGYDHKKMGITAKGAIISVESHFMSMGTDIHKDPISVVGIGDMSGDVFGNGMLLSKKIKLVAAFNHMHIFLDPNPDISKSYNERLRLFKLPRSKWSDYNTKLISKGGGIFDRSHKSLEISEQIQELLGIKCTKITPDNLIKAILKADVDLIWNGGIGTYIKSSLENNIDIGDKANDLLRVNGNEVRAKVIGEGGNLGISQLGRIEYAMNGGTINTDFIDNSAGVDCSDHEVNIKVAIDKALINNKMTQSERSKFLEKMTSEVEHLVLKNNHAQNLAITISQLSSSSNIESFSQLMRFLEKEGLLDRDVEFLPNNNELSRRGMLKQSLTRPELSVLLSYSKMMVDITLKDQGLIKDPYYEKFLIEYFPPLMHKKCEEEIKSHPLRDEIIRTVITNKLINQLGGTLVAELKSETGGQMCDIARAHSIVCEIFNLDDLWGQITNLPASIETSVKMSMFADITKMMRRGISWVIRNLGSCDEIETTVEEYRKQTSQVKKLAHTLLVGEAHTKFIEKSQKYETAGIDQDLAKEIAILDILVSAFDIIYIAKLTHSKGNDIANLYFETGEMLNIDWLRKSCDAMIDESYWRRLSIQSLKDDLYDKQRRLIIYIVKATSNNINLAEWLEEYKSASFIFTEFVENIKIQDALNLNMLMLATKKFELFLRKLQ